MLVCDKLRREGRLRQWQWQCRKCGDNAEGRPVVDCVRYEVRACCGMKGVGAGCERTAIREGCLSERGKAEEREARDRCRERETRPSEQWWIRMMVMTMVMR